MALRDKYEWLIGNRYLRAGQRRGFLSFISAISMVGLMLGVAVLVVVMVGILAVQWSRVRAG